MASCAAGIFPATASMVLAFAAMASLRDSSGVIFYFELCYHVDELFKASHDMNSMAQFFRPDLQALLFDGELSDSGFALDEEDAAFVGEDYEIGLTFGTSRRLRHAAMEINPTHLLAVVDDLVMKIALLAFFGRLAIGSDGSPLQILLKPCLHGDKIGFGESHIILKTKDIQRQQSGEQDRLPHDLSFDCSLCKEALELFRLSGNDRHQKIWFVSFCKQRISQIGNQTFSDSLNWLFHTSRLNDALFRMTDFSNIV
jgi:hypothetical protein